MPQITLEYTGNLKQDVNWPALFAQIHKVLADVGGIQIGNCKSRATELKDYYVGEGEDRNAFVHLEVRFVEGRSRELKQELGRTILSVLEEQYRPSLGDFDLQITVEIDDIQREMYFKIPEGTLTEQ